MKDQREQELLAKLDLQGLVLGQAEHLAWPHEETEQAKGIQSLLVAAALLSAEPPETTSVSIRALARIGVHVRAAIEEPRILKLSTSAADEAIALRPADRDTSRQAIASTQPDVVIVDTRASGPFLVQVSTGRVICTPTEDGIDFQDVLPPLELPALEPISAPLEVWMRDCRDQWIVSELQALRDTGTSWSSCVGAGIFARLAEPSTPPSPRQRLEAMLKGEVDTTIAAPRIWVRTLTPAQLETLEQLALAEVDRIHEALDEATASVSKDRSDQEDWLATCRARDDVEGIHLLLHEAGRSDALRYALASLDRRARLTRLGVPLRGIRQDEQLLRARLRDSDAWWGDCSTG